MPHQKATYEFGPFQLDLTQRVLTRDGGTISLAPKATELLILLVTNAGQLVEKDELLREIWPDTFVEEANLAQNIFTLRRVLGDDRIEPRYIETVAKRGYRFIAPVRAMRVLQHQSSPDVKGVTQSLPAPGNGRPVIAVLPFSSADQNSDAGSLTNNLTDSIINELSRLPRIHVMSRSSVLRYKDKIVDPQQVGKELGAQAVLVGRITSQPPSMSIAVELVDTWTGWQLWGNRFDSETKDFPELQDAIMRHLLSALGSSVTGDEEQRVTARYTENAEAYKSYLEGRFHWRMYTRKSIETAIGHFQHAIERDPHYALAYSGIVDCYLRLATNYLPPEDVLPTTGNLNSDVVTSNLFKESDPRIRLRFEWDWKSVERELRRANELGTNYPSTYQWHVAYKAAEQLYEECCAVNLHTNRLTFNTSLAFGLSSSSTQFEFLELTPNEEVQVYCAIVREQIDIGNYRAACRVLKRWWRFGTWPNFDGLSQLSCADLLLTTGVLAGCVASTKQLPTGQKHCEELLNGSIALFQQMGLRRGAAEGRIELALCYFRQGLFEVGRVTLLRVLEDLTDDRWELRSLALIRLAAIERHAGKPKDALARLSEAIRIAEFCGPWATGRCNLELASTYTDLAVREGLVDSFQEATQHYSKALDEFERIGNHRLSAITENNLGVVELRIGKFNEAQSHLIRARKTFDSFDDRIRRAQVDDSLAQLYCAQGCFDDADLAIQRAIQTMETGDEDAFLIEALTTRGLITCKLKKYSQAKTLLENAYRLAQRCGDLEGAGRALAILVEEMWGAIESEERCDIARRIVEILKSSPGLSIHKRLENCLIVHSEPKSEAS